VAPIVRPQAGEGMPVAAVNLRGSAGQPGADPAGLAGRNGLVAPVKLGPQSLPVKTVEQFGENKLNRQTCPYNWGRGSCARETRRPE